MIINYKELNKYTKFVGYFLPNKDTLITSVINKKIFSKFDCKFRCSKLNLKKRVHNLLPLVYLKDNINGL